MRFVELCNFSLLAPFFLVCLHSLLQKYCLFMKIIMLESINLFKTLRCGIN